MGGVCRRLLLSQCCHVPYHRNSLSRKFSATTLRKIIKPSLGADPSLQSVRIHNARFDKAHVSDFRELAFEPEKPLLLSDQTDGCKIIDQSFPIPAAFKWFTRRPQKAGKEKGHMRTAFDYKYLEQFGDHFFNYEVTVSAGPPNRPHEKEKFFQLHAPLHAIMSQSRLESAVGGTRYRRLRYYLAQTQIIDLPAGMQRDIETPHLVKEAGKGDIYDANIWIGQAPTYTPLHRDPNPNLFVQIASEKVVRIYEPSVGKAIFGKVQMLLGANASSVFRGEEMMEGPEKAVLDSAVWGPTANNSGYEAHVKAGDALFIPKGWWHSIKSVGPDINASVNWWFR